MHLENICTTYVVHKNCKTRYLEGLHTYDLREGDVLHGGIADLKTAFHIERPEPYYHCIIYTVKGKGVFYAHDGELAMTPGSVLVAPSMVPHHYKMIGKSWKIVFFYLSDTFIWQPVQDRQVTVSESPTVRDLEAVAEGFLAEQGRKEHDSARATQLFAELIEVYLRRDLDLDDDPKARAMRHQLYALWDEVASDLSRNWSVQGLAEHMGMSTACFYRVCAQYGGVKPMAMVTNLRMRRAEQALRVTDLPLKVIADQVGYSSAFSFSEAFSRHAGISPKDFRKANQG